MTVDHDAWDVKLYSQAQLDQEIGRYKQLCGMLYDALSDYADPGFYHAIAFLADHPAGGFADDESMVAESDYDRPMPGKLARETIDKAAAEFGDLRIIGRPE